MEIEPVGRGLRARWQWIFAECGRLECAGYIDQAKDAMRWVYRV